MLVAIYLSPYIMQLYTAQMDSIASFTMATGVHYITMLLADYITIFFVLQFLHSLVPRPECAPTGVHLGPASFIVKMLWTPSIVYCLFARQVGFSHTNRKII